MEGISEIPLPLGGFSEGLEPSQQEQMTSGYMLNCRPRDVLEGKLRLGQRPGLKKAYSQQIGGSSAPIVWMGSITTVS
jgi:hypothetical protein